MNMPNGERGFAPPQNQNERQPRIVSPEDFRKYEADLYAREAQRREVGHQVLDVVDVQPPASSPESDYDSTYEAMKARILAERTKPREQFGSSQPKINRELPAHMRGGAAGVDLSANGIRATTQANKHLNRNS